MSDAGLPDPDCAMCRAAPAMSVAFDLPRPTGPCTHPRGGDVPPVYEPPRFIPVTLESLRDGRDV